MRTRFYAKSRKKAVPVVPAKMLPNLPLNPDLNDCPNDIMVGKKKTRAVASVDRTGVGQLVDFEGEEISRWHIPQYL